LDSTDTAADAFIHYLDLTSTLRFFQQYKERTFEALELHTAVRVLDAGCGVGTDVFALADRTGPGTTVCGVDLDEALVAEASARAVAEGLDSIEFRTADVTALPFEDATFDACRADRVTVHVPDAARAVRELARVCRPDGVVFVGDPDYGTLVVDADADFPTRAVLAAYADGFGNPYVARRLPALFRQAGLVDVSVVADTFVVADHAVATQVFELPLIAERARERGVLSAAAAVHWIDHLRERGERGDFFAAITGFGVRGRKPQIGRTA
jgi:ubiquinone/menaquinone biosynthesis C-methylase UbiE